MCAGHKAYCACRVRSGYRPGFVRARADLQRLLRVGFVRIARRLGFVRAHGSQGLLARRVRLARDSLVSHVIRRGSGSLGLRGAWVRSRAGGSERLLRVGFARAEHGTPAPIGPRRAHDTAPADHGALLSWNVHGRGGHAAAGARQCSRLWECIQSGGPRTIARPTEHARVAPLVVQKMTAGLAAQLKTGQLPIAEPDMGQELNRGAEQL